MNLTDREILELNELCSGVIDGTITDAQQARLSAWLAASEPARQFYVRALAQSASLHSYASEMQAEAPERAVIPFAWSRPVIKWAGIFAAAAAVAFLLWLGTPPVRKAVDAVKADEYVAQLTGGKDSEWVAGSIAVQPGDHIRKGQRLELAKGRAEITFDSGARVVLEGATSLDVSSAWDSTLRRGTVTANVPPEAIGFRISNSTVEVMDLGTEFTMTADASGTTEVLVLKGEVEAAPRAGDDQETILLKAKEARRFADSGVSDVADSAEKFAQFTRPVSLDHFSPTVNFVHWSFNETSGDVVSAQVAGSAMRASDAQLKLSNVENLPAVHTPSPHGRALQFDGKLQASGHVAGISGSSPRTVAFWVKVPKEAVTDAWMVSWGTSVKKLLSRPVQISWNRRAGEGSFGALRTDFGGGYAIGSQDLRDGRWHHVAVFFAPGEDPDAPVQVKQYIDGRLESSTITLTPSKVVRSPLTGDAGLLDVVWLGCRLTGKQPERFRGEIDELFIADCGLEPQEIVSLMNDNRLPVAGLAAAQ
jgi:ferric-dicitrate binding protein FerR (iron transport regulator)